VLHDRRQNINTDRITLESIDNRLLVFGRTVRAFLQAAGGAWAIDFLCNNRRTGGSWRRNYSTSGAAALPRPVGTCIIDNIGHQGLGNGRTGTDGKSGRCGAWSTIVLPGPIWTIICRCASLWGGDHGILGTTTRCGARAARSAIRLPRPVLASIIDGVGLSS
jgi:hypothetical protein